MFGVVELVVVLSKVAWKLEDSDIDLLDGVLNLFYR